jgi:large subunit ribosomal protein L10
MAKVELKQPVVEEISKAVEGAQSAVLVQYLGLTVDKDTQLRKELREAGVNYKVYKNTMMKRAFEGTEFEALSQYLDGPNAIAISKDDAVAPERILAKYAKENECFNFVAGIVEGQLADPAKLEQYASIPSREVLLGRLAGGLQGIITNLARVLNQVAENGGAAAPAEAEAVPEA